MFSMTKWIAAPALAVGLMFAGDAPKAEAQYGCYGGYGGYSGIGISIGGSHYRSYRAPFYSSHLHRSHFGPSRSYFHDTSHYHWHPAEIRRHGNHWHVQPGHWDLHRTGHWHHR